MDERCDDFLTSHAEFKDICNSPRIRMTMKTKTPKKTDLTSTTAKSLAKREASGREPDMTARPPRAKLMMSSEPGDDFVPVVGAIWLRGGVWGKRAWRCELMMLVVVV